MLNTLENKVTYLVVYIRGFVSKFSNMKLKALAVV